MSTDNLQHIQHTRIGILGGMGAHAGAWLLQRIIALSDATSDQDYPDIILHNNSAIPDRTKAILYNGTSPLPELKRSMQMFNSMEVQIAVMACMTAHYYYKELSGIFKGNLINALDIIVQELRENNTFRDVRKIGLIGSTGLLKTCLIQDRIAPLGCEVIVLDDEEQEAYFMRPIYMEGGIKSGKVTGEVKELFSTQVDILTDRGADMIIGACSEVPLLLDPDMELPYMDVFDLLARITVQYYYNQTGTTVN